MAIQEELLVDGHSWWRIAERHWHDPLDPGFAAQHGGRWNAPGSHPTLYLNEDQVTARLNLREFIRNWPYEPEDLRVDTGPLLVGARLPRQQTVCDVHTRLGVVRAGLHPNYPYDELGKVLEHAPCQAIGARVKAAGLRGVRARSARARDGAPGASWPGFYRSADVRGACRH